MVNPIEIQSSLEGVDYPVDKKGLIKYAKEQGASREVLDTLKDLPDQEYNDITEVSSELKKDDENEDADIDEESSKPLLSLDELDDDVEE